MSKGGVCSDCVYSKERHGGSIPQCRHAMVLSDRRQAS